MVAAKKYHFESSKAAMRCLVVGIIMLQRGGAVDTDKINEWSLSAQGKTLVRSHNTTEKVQLRCASWYGADQKDYVPGGLDIQRAESIARVARDVLELNCIRLPLSVEVYINDPRPRPEVIAKHPEWHGLSAMSILDPFIAILQQFSLMVILDIHTLKNEWCCDAYDGDGLWYSKNFSESDWLRTLAGLAERYHTVAPNVIGIELRNEIRPSDPLGDGFLRYPTWGDGDMYTDWAHAAIRGAHAVLGVNPALLIIVGGIDFGLDLTGVASFPLHTAASGQTDRKIPRSNLVYAVHEYFWSCPDCESYDHFAHHLNRSWAFIHFDSIGPVFLSEFGSVHQAGVGFEPNNVDFLYPSSKGGSRGNPAFSSDLARWWSWLMTYLQDYHPGINFSYWPLDGTQSSGRSRIRGAEETYGLLDTSWSRPASKDFLSEIHGLFCNNRKVEALKAASPFLISGDDDNSVKQFEQQQAETVR